MNMTNETQNWEPCPSGELQQMVDRARSQKRAVWWRQFAAVAALLLVGCAGIGVAANMIFNPDLGPLTCSQVVPIMQEFHDGGLNLKTTANVQYHLDRCSHCRSKYERMFENQSRYDSSLTEVAFAQ